MKYLKSNFWNDSTNLNVSRINNAERFSKLTKANVEDVIFRSVKDIRIKNLNCIVLAHLNINFLRNKFDLLTNKIKEIVKALVISETNVDGSFLTGHFKISGYASLLRLDRNQIGDGIMVFVKEDIPVKHFLSQFHKKKWLVFCSCNPNYNNISRHIEALRKSLDLYAALYENTILLRDFNVSVDDPHMESFCESYRFKSLLKIYSF